MDRTLQNGRPARAEGERRDEERQREQHHPFGIEPEHQRPAGGESDDGDGRSCEPQGGA